jgi:hypothetical protein
MKKFFIPAIIICFKLPKLTPLLHTIDKDPLNFYVLFDIN